MNILVTGGNGYIGSHTVVELFKHGHEVVIVDNLINSSKHVLARLEKMCGKKIPFYKADCTNEAALSNVFSEHVFDAVIHFAALKAVGESVQKPLAYYQNNLDALLTLCRVLDTYGTKTLIFSSSATVYGKPAELPLKETSSTGRGITNPYGWTKFMAEQILRDIAAANPKLHVTALRYFNPIGAHESGLIGEDPLDEPSNLLPFISQVAVGKLPKLRIFGGDYDTADGTGVRDYIHVVDLARGHVAALEHPPKTSGLRTYNLGTGQGTSVLQLLHAFEKASGKTIAYEITQRRTGDIATCYADASKAENELDWKATKTIADACNDSWRWQSNNPNGYAA